jgi:hypothetical protein
LKGTQQQGRATPSRRVDEPALSQHAPARVLILAGLVVCLAGCQLPGIGATPTPTPTPLPTATATAGGDVWQALHRPLHVPTVTPGAPCPAAIERQVSPDFGPALGDGPVYPAGPWSHGTYSVDASPNIQGWHELKVLWISRPEYTGPILIRGQQIDGPNALRFGINGQFLLSELELPAGSGGYGAHGWGSWPSYTMPRVSGCYAYQVDGLSFSKVIVFQVVP